MTKKFPNHKSQLVNWALGIISSLRNWSLVIALLIIFLFWPRNPFDLSSVKITIPKGASAREVQTILKENRVLPHFSSFRIMIRLFGMQNRIKAGEYSFSPSDPLPRIIAKLLIGETVPQQQIKVTFPEGASIYKMGMILKDLGFTDWEKFQDLVNEGITARLRERHWKIFKYVPSESLEGYLFPDTYQFFADASAEAMAEVMLERFEEIVLPFLGKSKERHHIQFA